MRRAEKDPTSNEGWRTVRRALLGLVVGLAVGLGLTFLAVGRDDRPEATNDQPSDRDLLVAAWARSQRATYTLEGTFRRTARGRTVVDDPLVVVQRPPDRIALGYGSWDGVVGGRSIHCVRDGRRGEFRDCVVGEEVDRAAAARVDLAQLRRSTGGASPSYRVTALGGACFLLRVAEGRLPTPYGRRSRWCFDLDTDALVRSRVEHDDAVDEMVATSVRGRVDPSDLPATS